MQSATGADRRWWTLAVLCFGLFIITLDNTILNVALPTLVRDLHATASQLEWIVDAYILVFAGLLLTAGCLSDRFGRRGGFVVGLLIFGGCSGLAGLANSAGQLIAARAAMGVGGALIMPSTLSILTNIFPDEERGRAIGIWSAVSGIAIPLGPIIGGWLLEHASWSSIFFVNVPIVVIALAGTALLVPESRDPEPGPIDPVGALLSIAGLASLLYAIIEAPAQGWTDARILATFVVSALILVGFVVWELRSAHPMFAMQLFGRMRFTAASVALFLAFFALLGTTFFLTQYLQFVLGYSTLGAGVRMIPVAVGIMVAAPLSAQLAERFGGKLVVAAGLVGIAIGVGLFARATPDTGYGLVALAMLIGGLGMGLSITPATDSVMGAVPKQDAGVGSAMNDTTRELGGALGVAVMGSVMSTGFRSSISDALVGLPPAAAASAHDSVGAALVVAGRLGGQPGATLASAAHNAFIDGMGAAALTGAGVALVAAVVVCALLPSRATDVAAAPDLAEVETATP